MTFSIQLVMSLGKDLEKIKGVVIFKRLISVFFFFCVCFLNIKERDEIDLDRKRFKKL